MAAQRGLPRAVALRNLRWAEGAVSPMWADLSHLAHGCPGEWRWLSRRWLWVETRSSYPAETRMRSHLRCVR